MVSDVDDGDGLGAPSASPASPLPVAFVSHGAPLLALNAAKGAELTAWTRGMPRPRAILVLSAHWQAAPPTTGVIEAAPLIYDFYGFPDELQSITYPAPGAPWLADLVDATLGPRFSPARRTDRGLDHGVWVPLLHMYPGADIPVLELGWPARAGAAELFALGRALAPLRRQGVLVLGSGGFVHNLGRLDWSDRSAAPPWAIEFDDWAAEALAAGDFDALLDFRSRAPAAAMAHPTDEHFLPLIIAAGAASEGPTKASFPVQGFEYGSLSRRCVQFG